MLGLLLFLIYINDLPTNISSTVRLFADDCVLYSNIVTDLDSNRLQDDLDKLSTWADKWQMKFNTDKCNVLRISGSRSPTNSTYYLDNIALQEVSSHSYLGVEISNDLKWSLHIYLILLPRPTKLLGSSKGIFFMYKRYQN